MMVFNWQRRNVWTCALAALLAGWALASGAQAFILGDLPFDPWLGTATGSRTGNGRPVTLTWSIVPDGTSTPNLPELAQSNAPSDLISFLDTTIGGSPFGSDPNDLTARPWFDLLESSFDRWEQLGGVNYEYEPVDTGTNLAAASGVLGVRGDVRLGGRNIDDSGDTLAFNYLPNNGDMVIDTSESVFYGNPTSNYLALRNTIMHELGHGLALEHVVSSTDDLLLEPSINLDIEGPQLDEVRAIHYYYGDINEKSNSGQGNDSYTHATDLGTLALGSTLSIGTDANVPTQRIEPTATDFVSISNLDDNDYYSVIATDPGLLSVTVTPHGGTFTQSGQGGFPTSFNADERVDLNFYLYDASGTNLLVYTDTGGLGFSDQLIDFELPTAGEYFIRVSGAEDTIQLYQLDVSLRTDVFLESDFNEDSLVDSTDLGILQLAHGDTDFGDTDNDGDTDGSDFLLWQRQFHQQPGGSPGLHAVPEPANIILLYAALLSIEWRHSRMLRRSIS